MKMLSERKLTIGYMAALGLVAFLTIASHITLTRVLVEHEGSAEIVNVSGRQRMLSQRIASLAAQYRLGSPAAKADLLSAVSQFEAAHHKLLVQSTEAGRSSSVFRDIYFNGGAPLDGEVTTFVDLARRVAQAPASAETGPVLDQLFREARSPLLKRLDEVVVRHQQDSEEQLSRLEVLQAITLAVVLSTLAIEALMIFRPMVRSVARYARELLHLATTDGLTGALNRTSFLERGTAELARAQRHGEPVSLLMLDADHFKAINDTFGHAGGDAALRALGQVLGQTARSGDLFGRLGGEEFAMLLPGMAEPAAAAFAQRLLGKVANLPVAYNEKTIRLTVSIGMGTAGTDGSADLPRLMRMADKALYEAKAGGRNRVQTDSASVPLASPVLAWSQPSSAGAR